MASRIDPGEHEGKILDKGQALEEALRLLDEGSGTEVKPEELRWLPERNELQDIRLRKEYAEQDIALRSNYAERLLQLLALQLSLADAVFVVFAWAGKNWDLSDGVMEIWLAAVVVQVIGVVTVVTRHLFPPRAGDT